MHLNNLKTKATAQHKREYGFTQKFIFKVKNGRENVQKEKKKQKQKILMEINIPFSWTESRLLFFYSNRKEKLKKKKLIKLKQKS